MKLTMQVNNVTGVFPGTRIAHVFTLRGGLVGAAPDADWMLQNSDRKLPEQVAKIVAQGERFCIVALPEGNIRINEAHSVLAPGRQIILNDRDVLHFHGLEVSVRVSNASMAEDSFDGQRLEAVVGPAQYDRLVEDGRLEIAREQSVPHREIPRANPLDAFKRHSDEHQGADPVHAFDLEQEKYRGEPMNTDMDSEHVLAATRQDGTNSVYAAIEKRVVTKDEFGFEVDTKFDDAELVGRPSDAVELTLGPNVDHIALAPLANNLGVSLVHLSPTEAEETLADIGAALNAAISGLNKLFRSREGKAHKFPLASMHMHAIEDNPLRFSQGVDEALQALFVSRGLVHLNAPAALSESITHLDHHQHATEYAIDTALDAVMHALHPDALTKRFSQYSRHRIPEQAEARDAWKWRMFEAYVAEMLSSRQRGLQLLFWEVFANAYQDKMRDLDRSNHHIPKNEDESSHG